MKFVFVASLSHSGSTLLDMIADPNVDLVDICLPPALHARMTVKALQAGKDVFCEKPMAMTTADTRRMVAAAEKARRPLEVHSVLVQLGQRQKTPDGHVVQLAARELGRGQLAYVRQLEVKGEVLRSKGEKRGRREDVTGFDRVEQSRVATLLGKERLILEVRSRSLDGQPG